MPVSVILQQLGLDTSRCKKDRLQDNDKKVSRFSSRSFSTRSRKRRKEATESALQPKRRKISGGDDGGHEVVGGEQRMETQSLKTESLETNKTLITGTDTRLHCIHVNVMC